MKPDELLPFFKRPGRRAIKLGWRLQITTIIVGRREQQNWLLGMAPGCMRVQRLQPGVGLYDFIILVSDRCILSGRV